MKTYYRNHSIGLELVEQSDIAWVNQMEFNSSEGFQKKLSFPAGRWATYPSTGKGTSFWVPKLSPGKHNYRRWCTRMKADLLFQLKIILQLSTILWVKRQSGVSWYNLSPHGFRTSVITLLYLYQSPSCFRGYTLSCIILRLINLARWEDCWNRFRLGNMQNGCSLGWPGGGMPSSSASVHPWGCSRVWKPGLLRG